MRILVQGGGDLASGVVVRLHRAGWQVMVAELAQPLAVRRYVSFAQAVYDGEMQVEEVRARRIADIEQAWHTLAQGFVPVIIDAEMAIRGAFEPQVIIDGRMRKKPPEPGLKETAPLVIGLGPGFTAGLDCHVVIETNRGPYLGRTIWKGQAQPDTGIPERVGDYRVERVLRAPAEGSIEAFAEIGAHVRQGDTIAKIATLPVIAPFDGVVRGLAQAGLHVRAGEKIGDLDPRGDPRLCWLVSDKALSVGGGVLEAILSWPALRGER